MKRIVVPYRDQDMAQIVRALPATLKQRKHPLIKFLWAGGSHCSFYEYRVKDVGVVLQIADDASIISHAVAIVTSHQQYIDQRVSRVFWQPLQSSLSAKRQHKAISRVHRSLCEWLIDNFADPDPQGPT